MNSILKTIFRFLTFINTALAFRFADLMEVNARFDADCADVYWRRWGRHVQCAVVGNGLTGKTADAAYSLGRYYFKRVRWGADEDQMLRLCRDAISRLAKASAAPSAVSSAKPVAFLTQDVGGAQ